MNDYTLYLVKRAYYKKQLIKRAYNTMPEDRRFDQAYNNLSMTRQSFGNINKALEKNINKLEKLEGDYGYSLSNGRPNPAFDASTARMERLWEPKRDPVSDASILRIIQNKNSNKFDPAASLKSIRRRYNLGSELGKDKARRKQYESYVQNTYPYIHDGNFKQPSIAKNVIDLATGRTSPTIPQVNTRLDYKKEPRKYI